MYSLFEVHFDALLRGSELSDGLTSMAVAGSVAADGVVRLATVPDSLLARVSGFRIDVSPGTDQFLHPTESRKRVEKLIREHPCAELTKADFEDNKLVGIKFGNNIWEDDGVFYRSDPNPSWRAAVESVMGPAKKAGVHPIGRAALMLKVLFAVAGIADTTVWPFFRLVDVWSGRARVATAALVDTVKSMREFDEHETLRDKIIACLEGYGPTHHVKISSVDLDEEGLRRRSQSVRGKAMFGDVASIVDARRTGGDPDDSDDEGELPEDIADVSDAMFRTLHKLVVAGYKDNFMRKFDSAVVVGTKPDRWPQWKDSIHSLYSQQTRTKGVSGKEYKHTPWAVAASFVETEDFESDDWYRLRRPPIHIVL